MITTPIEQKLIDELIKSKIPLRPQEPVDWNTSYCRSKYPCKCGLDWSDPETGEWQEGDSQEYPENCDWFQDGHYSYFIDIFIPIGKGIAIEIDDKASHSSEYQIDKDNERQEEIIRILGCKFMRFTAKKVWNEVEECVSEVQEKVCNLMKIILIKRGIGMLYALEYSKEQQCFHVQKLEKRLSSERNGYKLLGLFNSTEEALKQSELIEKIPGWKGELCQSPTQPTQK